LLVRFPLSDDDDFFCVGSFFSCREVLSISASSAGGFSSAGTFSVRQFTCGFFPRSRNPSRKGFSSSTAIELYRGFPPPEKLPAPTCTFFLLFHRHTLPFPYERFLDGRIGRLYQATLTPLQEDGPQRPPVSLLGRKRPSPFLDAWDRPSFIRFFSSFQ